MYTNRFMNLLVVISLLAVTVLVVRHANATAPLVPSATRSYTAWAKAAEAETSTVNSATLSYLAQAKAVACSLDATDNAGLDSATRSYIAWGSALQAQSGIGAVCS